MYTAWPTGGNEVCRIGNERTTAVAATLVVRVDFEIFNKNPITTTQRVDFLARALLIKRSKPSPSLSSNKLQFGFPFNVSRRLRLTSYISGSRSYTLYYTLYPFFYFCFYPTNTSESIHRECRQVSRVSLLLDICFSDALHVHQVIPTWNSKYTTVRSRTS